MSQKKQQDGTMKALNVSSREKKDYPQEFKLKKTLSDVQTLSNTCIQPSMIMRSQDIHSLLQRKKMI
jgi:hypothetical protein